MYNIPKIYIPYRKHMIYNIHCTLYNVYHVFSIRFLYSTTYYKAYMMYEIHMYEITRSLDQIHRESVMLAV